MIIDGQRKKKGKRKEKIFCWLLTKKELDGRKIFFEESRKQEAKAERRKKDQKKREEKEKQKIIEYGQKGKREKQNAERGLKAHRTRIEAACFILQFKT